MTSQKTRNKRQQHTVCQATHWREDMYSYKYIQIEISQYFPLFWIGLWYGTESQLPCLCVVSSRGMTKAETRHSGSYSVIWGRWCLYNTNCVMWESATFGETRGEYSGRFNQKHGGRHVYLNKTIILWHSCAAVNDWMQSMKREWHDKRMRPLSHLMKWWAMAVKNLRNTPTLENTDIFFIIILV